MLTTQASHHHHIRGGRREATVSKPSNSLPRRFVTTIPCPSIPLPRFVACETSGGTGLEGPRSNPGRMGQTPRGRQLLELQRVRRLRPLKQEEAGNRTRLDARRRCTTQRLAGSGAQEAAPVVRPPCVSPPTSRRYCRYIPARHRTIIPNARMKNSPAVCVCDTRCST